MLDSRRTIKTMHSPLAQAIRTARLASGLTQDQLGTRLGLKGRAVSRWELDTSAPRRRHRRELVAVISASNQAAAATLAAVIASETKRGRRAPTAPPTPTPEPPPPAINPQVQLDLAVFAMADELDVPAGRLRAALIKLLKRMRETNLTLDAAQLQLEQRNAPALAKP